MVSFSWAFLYFYLEVTPATHSCYAAQSQSPGHAYLQGVGQYKLTWQEKPSINEQVMLPQGLWVGITNSQNRSSRDGEFKGHTFA